jgi:hypothetical protein
MIFAYLLFLLCGVVAFFALYRIRVGRRIAISVAVVLLPSVVWTVVLANLRDEAPPGSRTVVPSELEPTGADEPSKAK